MSIGNKLSAVTTVVTSKAGRSLLKTQKHSPVILFGAGVIGFGATIYLASKATLELDNVLTQHEKNAGIAHDQHELARLGSVEYSDKAYDKDKRVLKARLYKDLTKLYTPAAVCGVVSIGALTGSHVIMNRRYAGVVAAYATLDRSFREYQDRVAELAPELDQRILRNGSEEREIVSADGSKVSVVKESLGRSPYAMLFSKETSATWSPQPEHNFFLLQARQTYANDMLRIKGHVFLNEIYDSLGLDRTKAGAVTGWVKDGKGNNFIDFGIFDDENKFVDFATGRENAIWLDFNVDGVILDLI